MMQMLRSLSGISLLLCMVCMVGSTAAFPSVSKEAALDPDETSFAFTRSIELCVTRGNGFSADEAIVRAERIRNWSRWQFGESFAAADPQTSCFVRELLSRLGLLDVGGGYFRVGSLATQRWKKSIIERNGYFQTEQLWAQYRQYKEFLNCTEQDVGNLADGLGQYSELRDSDAIFHAFKESIVDGIDPRIDLFLQLFLLDPVSALAIYKHLGSSIRQPNQSVFEHCENEFYHDKRDVWCAARNYSIPEDGDFSRHMECIFKGLHYFKRGGELDVDEICRDFHQVGIHHLDSNITQVLRSCEVNSGARALSYYRCLLTSDFLEQFKEALDYREIRSSDHYYALRKSIPVYDRIQVQHKIESVNHVHCTVE
ncbi:hypothetical protein RP20_CCG014636 [Aedes albopictus]|nr:hypothetical protein RP20_CCG014636 [Aedes albopictus]